MSNNGSASASASSASSSSSSRPRLTHQAFQKLKAKRAQRRVKSRVLHTGGKGTGGIAKGDDDPSHGQRRMQRASTMETSVTRPLASGGTLPRDRNPGTLRGGTMKGTLRRKFKKFSYAEIEKRVKERQADIPQYRSLLMAAAINEDDDGVTFDSTHPAWKQLLALVKKKKVGTTPRRRPGTVGRSFGTFSGPMSIHIPLPDAGAQGGAADVSDASSVGGGDARAMLSPDGRRYLSLTLKRKDKSNKQDPAPKSALSTLFLPLYNNSSSSGGDSSPAKRTDGDLLVEISKEMKAIKPRKDVVLRNCKICGVPDSMRGAVWRLLLGISLVDLQGGRPKTVRCDLPNQRVIRVDIDRTLTHLEKFRSDKMKRDMEVLLTRYCKENNVSYKQGMNYVLAPFFLVGLTSSRDVFECYSAFIKLFLPNTYTDSEFGALQCIFALFRILLYYHDPELARHLAAADIGPELYTSSWFITLYANRLDVDVVTYLWDHLLLEADEDPMLHYFVSLALIESHREEILSQDEVVLPQYLSGIRIHSKQEVVSLIKAAKEYRSNTLMSFRSQLKSTTEREIQADSQELEKLSARTFLSVSALEIVSSCYHDATLADAAPSAAASPVSVESAPAPSSASAPAPSSSTSSARSQQQVPAAAAAMPVHHHGIKFFILDCRSSKEYSAGYLPTAYNLDPSLDEKAFLQKIDNELGPMKGRHFVVLSRSDSNSAMNAKSGKGRTVVQCIEALQERGFKYVSLCTGGYKECHRIVQSSKNEYELVDHDPSTCLECKPSRSRKGFFSSVRQKFSGLMERKNASSITVEQLANGVVKSEAYKANHLPDSVLELPASAEILLLHSVLRNKTSGGRALTKSAVRLFQVVLGAALTDLETKEQSVATPGGAYFTGAVPVQTVCVVALSATEQKIVRQGVEPFVALAHMAVGALYFARSAKALSPKRTPSAASSSRRASMPSPSSSVDSLAAISDDASNSTTLPSVPRARSGSTASPEEISAVASGLVVDVPDDIASRYVYLFRSVLAPESEWQVMEAIAELKRRGVVRVTVICLVAARPTVWKLTERYPKTLVVSSAIDEYVKTRLVPGVGLLENRLDETVLHDFEQLYQQALEEKQQTTRKVNMARSQRLYRDPHVDQQFAHSQLMLSPRRRRRQAKRKKGFRTFG